MPGFQGKVHYFFGSSRTMHSKYINYFILLIFHVTDTSKVKLLFCIFRCYSIFSISGHFFKIFISHNINTLYKVLV
jgi:hypothetical protein